MYRNLIKQTDNIIDVGANVGFFTTLFAELAPQGTVFAFEPEPDCYRELEEKTKQLPNVLTYNKIVSASNMVKQLYRCTDETVGGWKGMHRIYPSKWCEKDPIPVVVE